MPNATSTRTAWRDQSRTASGVREGGRWGERMRGAGGVVLDGGLPIVPTREDIDARYEAMTAGHHVEGVAYATAAPEIRGNQTLLQRWWERQSFAAERNHVDGDYNRIPEMASPSGARRVHRMLYEGEGTQLRMPSAAAIRRYAAGSNGTFDVPVETVNPDGSMTGWVRVSKTGDRWHVTPVGVGGNVSLRTAEAVSAILENRRPTQGLRQAGDLLERHRTRQATGIEMQPVTSSWVTAVGYDDANSVLAVQTSAGRTYGYSTSRQIYEGLVSSQSVGAAYNHMIRGREAGAGVQQCETCGRFMAAGGAHTCATSHGSRPGVPTASAVPPRPSVPSATSASPTPVTPATPRRRRRTAAERAAEAAASAPAPAPEPIPEPEPIIVLTQQERLASSLRGTETESMVRELARHNISVGQTAGQDPLDGLIRESAGDYDRAWQGNPEYWNGVARRYPHIAAIVGDIEDPQDRELLTRNLYAATAAASNRSDEIARRLRCTNCGRFTAAGPAHADCPRRDRVARIGEHMSRRSYPGTGSGPSLYMPNISGVRAALRSDHSGMIQVSADGVMHDLHVTRAERRQHFTVHTPTPDDPLSQIAAQQLEALLNATRTAQARLRDVNAAARAGVTEPHADSRYSPANWAPESSWADGDEGFAKFNSAYIEARQRRERGEQIVPYRRESVTGNPDATFGVEFEVVGVRDTYALARDLHAAGLTPSAHVNGYHGGGTSARAYQKWKIETDGSLRSPTGSGIEVPTRAMRDTPESWAELKTGLEIIRRHGGHVNSSCGAHMNVGLEGAGFGTDPTPYSNIIGEWSRSADTVVRLSTNPAEDDHRSYQGNSYAQANPTPPAEGYHSIDAAINRNTRPSAVNLSHSSSHNGAAQRVEFRVFDGVNVPNGDNLTSEQWAEAQVGVIQARFLMAHGMVHAASRAAQSEDRLEPVRAEAEPVGTRRATFRRRSLDATEFRESSKSLLSHLDRWIPDDAGKAQVAALWATTKNQGRN